MLRLFRFLTWLGRWKFVTAVPPEGKRCVLLFAPHTSNWDFVNGLGGLHASGIKGRFAIKIEWMRFPLGLFMRSLGAIGIDRKPATPGGKKASTVEAMVKLFKDNEELAIILSPEGTRKRNDKWHAGFYHIAVQAKVPILLSYLDYEKKQTGIGKVIWPSEAGFEHDMRLISDFYKDCKAAYPENFALDARFPPNEPAKTEK